MRLETIYYQSVGEIKQDILDFVGEIDPSTETRNELFKKLSDLETYVEYYYQAKVRNQIVDEVLQQVEGLKR